MRPAISSPQRLVRTKNIDCAVSLKEILCSTYLFIYLDGASLVYTSIKNNSNLNLLYEYILSLAYNFPFKYKPESSN
jgi:hypothetical protein